jgi:hypothetical protein
VNGSAAGEAVWIQTVGALALLAVAVVCTARLVQSSRAADPWDAADRSHGADVLMALGMAAMLSPLGDPVPPAVGALAFGLVAAWSLVAVAGAGARGRRTTPVQHAVGAAAMVLMFAMPAGLAWTLLTWALAAGFAVIAVWSALGAVRGASAVAAAEQTAPALALAPPVTCACHLLMAAGMVSLLLAMR